MAGFWCCTDRSSEMVNSSDEPRSSSRGNPHREDIRDVMHNVSQQWRIYPITAIRIWIKSQDTHFICFTFAIYITLRYILSESFSQKSPALNGKKKIQKFRINIWFSLPIFIFHSMPLSHSVPLHKRFMQSEEWAWPWVITTAKGTSFSKTDLYFLEFLCHTRPVIHILHFIKSG